MDFVNRAMPIDDINSKSHKTELKSSRKLFSQSYEVEIVPPAIYGLEGVHTHEYAFAHQSGFKKPGVCRPVHAWFKMCYVKKNLLKFSNGHIYSVLSSILWFYSLELTNRFIAFVF